MNAGSLPVLQAVLLCASIDGALPGPFSLRDVFSTILAPAPFPVEHARPCSLFVQLLGAAGPFRLRMELRRVADDALQGGGEQTVVAIDPWRPTVAVFPISSITFDVPGDYVFNLFVDDRFLGSAPLHVEQHGDAPAVARDLPALAREL